jgi:hypothetical protein
MISEHKSPVSCRETSGRQARWLSRDHNDQDHARGGSEAIAEHAKARAADLAPTITELQAAGATSLREIAAGLNERGIPTARGTGRWSATQVMRVLARRETNLTSGR